MVFGSWWTQCLTTVVLSLLHAGCAGERTEISLRRLVYGADLAASQKRADTRDGRFYSFAFADQMPKINTNNEEVIDYFCGVCEGWITDYDIDGIRFDVGNEVSHRFLKRFGNI